MSEPRQREEWHPPKVWDSGSPFVMDFFYGLSIRRREKIPFKEKYCPETFG